MSAESRQIKEELTEYVLAAIHEYRRTTRGARLLGAGSLVTMEKNVITVASSTRGPNGPSFFEIKIKEVI